MLKVQVGEVVNSESRMLLKTFRGGGTRPRAGLSSGLIRRGSRASAEGRTKLQLQVTDRADLPRTHAHRLGKRVGASPREKAACRLAVDRDSRGSLRERQSVLLDLWVGADPEHDCIDRILAVTDGQTGRPQAACGVQRGRVDTAGGRSPCHLHAFCIAPASVRVAMLGDKGHSSRGNRRHGPAAAGRCVPSRGQWDGVTNGRHQKPRYAFLRHLECARS